MFYMNVYAALTTMLPSLCSGSIVLLSQVTWANPRCGKGTLNRARFHLCQSIAIPCSQRGGSCVAMRTTHSSLSTQSAGGPLRGVGTNGTRAKPAGALFENRCPYPSEDGKIGEEGEKKELR